MRQDIAGTWAAIDIIAEKQQKLSAGKGARIRDDVHFGLHHLIITAMDVAERVDRRVITSGEIDAVSLMLHEIDRFLPGRA
ncbi:hypothetical protein RsS62_32780 [Rhizobium dioscoreae]|nr:hypothetical protein RsS62_32780 [Rhizobium dioscoreae]GLU80115.1 hypothetical protein Rhsp01_12910 [Rhizobium sp. NBRC 114257]